MVDSRGYERCPVVFNMNDPFQKKLYDHVHLSTNFSYFIKTLIQRDMEGAPFLKVVPIEKEEVIDKGLVQGLI